MIVEVPGKLRALFYLASRKPLPERYRPWLARELSTSSRTRFAIKASLLNIIMVLVMALLVLSRGQTWFAVAFALLAVALFAFVALVPEVGRQRMARLAERNGLKQEEQAPTDSQPSA